MKMLYETGIKKYGKRNYMFAMFICECGKEIEMAKHRGLATLLCWECFRLHHKKKVTKHGDRYTRLYRIWINMNKRCRDMENKNYAKKGILVCDDWKKFENFKSWSYKNGYTDKLTIDRIDNNGNYEPSNCQWISNKLNAGKDKCSLTIEEVKEIRKLYSSGNILQKHLAIQFKTDYRTISRIVNNKSYTDDIYQNFI